MTRRITLWLALAFVFLVPAGVALAQQVVDQGQPGTQGAWPVSISGATVNLNVAFDGGVIGQTFPAPCSNLVMTNDAGYSTTPSRVPANGGTSGRIWIRICNDITNSSSTICRCSTGQFCPAATGAGNVGDALATGDCVTYNQGYGDAGTPCCVCNGAGSFLPATECIP